MEANKKATIRAIISIFNRNYVKPVTDRKTDNTEMGEGKQIKVT